jgi:hypothetical protein
MHSSTMNAQECMDVVVTTGVAIGSLKMLQLLLRQTHHLIKHISTSSAQFLSSVSGLLLHRLMAGALRHKIERLAEGGPQTDATTSVATTSVATTSVATTSVATTSVVA